MTAELNDVRTQLVRKANNVKVNAVVAMFFAGVILGPIVINQANKVLKNMSEANLGEDALAIPRTAKAIATFAIVLHIIAIITLVLVGMISSA